MSDAPAANAELARLLKRLARFRDGVALSRNLGLPMPFRRRRRDALLRELRRSWPGAYAIVASGELMFLPAPLEFQALRLLFDADTVPAAILAHLPVGGVALDIGANLGEWTLPLARATGGTGRVIAIEPNPTVADALRLTLNINDMSQCKVLQCALSDRPGAGQLHLNEANSGMARLGVPDRDGGTVGVDVTTCDALAARERIERLDFVKIDVEGHERQVLEGGRDTLARFHPALVIETGHEEAADRAVIADLLEGLGYRPVAVLFDHGALPASFADYRAAAGACAGREARNLFLLPVGRA